MPVDTAVSRAIEALDLKRQAIAIALDKLGALIRSGADVNVDLVSSQMRQLHARNRDLDAMQQTLVLTGAGAPFPSEGQLQGLRDAVRELQVFNVVAANVQGFISDVFALVDAFSSGGGSAAIADPGVPPPRALFGAADRLGRSAHIDPVAHIDPDIVPTGRYMGLTPELACELRVAADGVTSADLFRLDVEGGRTWVASFRTVTPGKERRASIFAEDRYGATCSGWLSLSTPTSGAAHALIHFDDKLDGLPVRREIALTLNYIGRALRTLGLEVELERDVVGPPTTTFRDTAMSIEVALSRANVEVRPAGVTSTIGAAPPEGWSEKDIESLMVDFAQIDMEKAGFNLQLLWLSKSNRPGLLGVMFDTADDLPRQSLAVFAGEIRDRFGDDQMACDRKLIQTTVHEIGHAFNLAHRFEREVGRADSTSFMNYDWRYRGGDRAAEFWEKFAYQFDKDEVGFLCHAPYPAIVMGGAGFHSVRYWNEGDGGYSPYVPERPLSGVELRLHAPEDRVFRFGQPVLLGLELFNRTNSTLRLPASVLDPKAGFVEVLIRRVAKGRPPSGAHESFHPVVTRCFEISADQVIELRPGQSMTDNMNITFGAAGFTFAEPGTYEITALLVFYDRQREVELIAPSAALQITVSYPQARADYGVADLMFGDDIGRWIALGAPARLDDLTEELLARCGAGRQRAELPPEIAANVVRTAMFGVARPALRLREGVMQRREGDPERARALATRLGELGLETFDPVTAGQTREFIASLGPNRGPPPEDDPAQKVELAH